MKINIMPLARVEGEGGIYVEMEDERVKEVRMDIYEGPRLIETVVLGKRPDDVISIVTRICSICSTSHRLASVRGFERAGGVEVPEKIRLLRKLVHYGEYIESHSLHYYLLALPDFFGYPDAISMAEKYGDLVLGGLELKKFGNFIMETINGKAIHGENIRIGYMGRIPEKDALEHIKSRALALIPVIEDGIMAFPAMEIPDYMEEETNFICLVPEDDGFGFIGNTIITSKGERFDVEEYKKVTNERVVPHSFAKRSSYAGSPFTVGALARVNILGERLPGKAGDFFRRLWSERWKRNPLFNNLAQAIEILFCLEQIPPLVDRILSLPDPELKEPEVKEGEGTGAVEAPRGTLYHHYKVENGRTVECDIITPTAQNLDDMEKYLRRAAENLGKNPPEDFELRLELIPRAYDPCISCSVHMLRVKVKK